VEEVVEREDRAELIVERTGDVWVLTLRGEHDVANAGTLGDELEAIYGHGSKVVIDLAEATFIDSTVMGQLVRGELISEHADQHAFAIVAPTGGHPRHILGLVALDHQLPVYESRAEALAAVAGQPT
jgi:anti-anti-sigma factor